MEVLSCLPSAPFAISLKSHFKKHFAEGNWSQQKHSFLASPWECVCMVRIWMVCTDCIDPDTSAVTEADPLKIGGIFISVLRSFYIERSTLWNNVCVV